ncbi:hypothetical protein HAX54_038410, partial [Datura stramonium]|nr:hypothetical protein [Datura stramonium]
HLGTAARCAGPIAQATSNGKIFAGQDVLRRTRVKKGQRFIFWGLLTRFLRGYQIEEEEVDYRPRYDPNGID